MIDVAVWMVLLAVLAPALGILFGRTIRLSMSSILYQKELTRFGSELNIILADLRSASKNSIGSLLVNGNFELAQSTSVPRYWSGSVAGGNGSYAYVTDSNLAKVENGYHSLALKTSDGTAVTYDYSSPMTLSPGNAYILTARVRCTINGNQEGRVSLLDTSNNLIAQVKTSSITWQKMTLRYPAVGVYAAGTLPSDRVRLRLTNIALAATGVGDVYFDNISLTGIYSIVIATAANLVNVNSAVYTSTTPNECAGFQFARWDENNNVLNLYRYRAATGVAGNKLLREKYDMDSSKWVTAGGNAIFSGIRTFAIGYSEDFSLPAKGKDGVLTVTISALKNKQDVKTRTVRVLPVAP